jgi:NAD(P)-dependent dehydrogenase (short-subunit alcohol dehydrogenase family)
MHKEIYQLFDLTKKVAFIVGGSRHLGYDMAEILAAARCDLVITSRDAQRAKAAAERLVDKYGIDVLPLELDHTEYEQVCLVASKAFQWKENIHILINNAGGGSGQGPRPLFERSPEDINSLIAKNLTGVLYCCKEVGKLMAKQGYGKIINIASIAGMIGRDRRMYHRSDMNEQPVDYAAAKAGVIGMTRDLAGYLSPMCINVNCISPGGFNRDLPDTFVKDYGDRTPLNRMGIDGQDIKGAVLFLASPASDYVTGHNLIVDGGFSLWK